MKTLLFVSRVTFIYNLCMIVTLLMGYINFGADKGLRSTILVAGLFLSIVFNVITSLWMLVLLLRKHPLQSFVPAWLFIANLLCFIYQIYMLLK